MKKVITSIYAIKNVAYYIRVLLVINNLKTHIHNMYLFNII